LFVLHPEICKGKAVVQAKNVIFRLHYRFSLANFGMQHKQLIGTIW